MTNISYAYWRDTHPTATSSLIDAANLEIIPALTYVSRPIWIHIFHWNNPTSFPLQLQMKEEKLVSYLFIPPLIGGPLFPILFFPIPIPVPIPI